MSRPAQGEAPLPGGTAGPAELERLRTALRTANGTRQVRLLTEAQVAQTVAGALAAPEGVAVLHGGEANDGTQRTTLCLAVRDGEFLSVGVGLSGAAGAGPGRTWKELQPWSRTDPAKNAARLQAWARAKAADRVRLRVRGEPPAKARPDEAEATLLAAVLAQPEADALRMVYADWLQARSDPRGEFIALQLTLARRPTAAAQQRADALLKQHGLAWTQALRQLTLKQRFERGFVFEVELQGMTLLRRAPALFALAPLTSLDVRGVDLRLLGKLLALPELARLRQLGLDRPLGDEGAALLAACPALGRLEVLRCDGCRFGAEGYARLLESLPALRHLHVGAVDGALAKRLAKRKAVRVTTP